MLIRLYRGIEIVLSVLAGTALLIMMVLTFVDVIGRYGFNASIFGTAEYIQILMSVTIFAGIAFVSATDDHIKVEIFERWINAWCPNFKRWTTLLFALAVYALITYQLFRFGFTSLESGRVTAVLYLPQWFIPMGAAVLSLLGVALTVIAILRTGGHVEALRSGDSGPSHHDRTEEAD